jgi:hypothetical protein
VDGYMKKNEKNRGNEVPLELKFPSIMKRNKKNRWNEYNPNYPSPIPPGSRRSPRHPKPDEHSKPPTPPKSSNEKNPNPTSFIDKEVCVEAKVTVNPEVSIGKVTIECLDSTIEHDSKFNKASSEECTIYVNQLIRVKIPIRFSAKADAEKKGVICDPVHPEESSPSSSSD